MFGFGKKRVHRCDALTNHGQPNKAFLVYVGLLSHVPEWASDWIPEYEVIGCGYARQPVVLAAKEGRVGFTNVTTAEYKVLCDHWPRVVGVAVFTPQDRLYPSMTSLLSAPKRVQAGDTFAFARGSIAFDLTNNPLL